MKVKDIMTKKVLTVSPDDKIGKVAEIMNQHRIHSVPVVQKKKVLGIIAEADFFTKNMKNFYLPSYIEFLQNTCFSDKLSAVQEKKINKLLNAKAKDIMTSSCVTIKENSDIIKLLEIFKTTKFYSLPVVNEDNDFVGIITLSDILRFLKTK